jgi:hypothetical protein
MLGEIQTGLMHSGEAHAFHSLNGAVLAPRARLVGD